MEEEEGKKKSNKSNKELWEGYPNPKLNSYCTPSAETETVGMDSLYISTTHKTDFPANRNKIFPVAHLVHKPRKNL